jgi:tRNA-specific 2-thiouridylase
VLGTHPGIVHFTVGQRKGLGLAGNEQPLFAVKLDAGARRVVVGPRAALRTKQIRVAHVNVLAPMPEVCAVKIRSTRPPTPARVIALGESAADVELLNGEDAVAPGQACVFYEENGTRVLGGGWIVKTEGARGGLIAAAAGAKLDRVLQPPLHRAP